MTDVSPRLVVPSAKVKVCEPDAGYCPAWEGSVRAVVARKMTVRRRFRMRSGSWSVVAERNAIGTRRKGSDNEELRKRRKKRAAGFLPPPLFIFNVPDYPRTITVSMSLAIPISSSLIIERT